jgi:hypothetical protein
LPGTNGINGTNGTNGATGPQGPQGLQGINGTNGVNGTNGLNGTNGATGPQGLTGTFDSGALTNYAQLNGSNVFTGPTVFSGNVIINSTNAGVIGGIGQPEQIQNNQNYLAASDGFVWGVVIAGIHDSDHWYVPSGNINLTVYTGFDTNNLTSIATYSASSGYIVNAPLTVLVPIHGGQYYNVQGGNYSGNLFFLPLNLQGLQGTAGTNGINGTNGATGPQGPPGEAPDGVITINQSGVTLSGTFTSPHGIAVYTNAGTFTWTNPGVSSVLVKMWGGGGRISGNPSGGGGGGAYCEAVLSVSNNVSFVVGNVGGDSSFLSCVAGGASGAGGGVAYGGQINVNGNDGVSRNSSSYIPIGGLAGSFPKTISAFAGGQYAGWPIPGFPGGGEGSGNVAFGGMVVIYY